MAQAPIARVLFVCLGNICRSPMAEGILHQVAARKGVVMQVDSAGTGDWHVGNPPDRRAQATALRHGVDISGLCARQVTARDFHDFTHVIAMDPDNIRSLLALRPADSPSAFGLLFDHLPGREGQGVTDPYFGDDDGFEIVWREIADAVDRLSEAIIADHQGARG